MNTVRWGSGNGLHVNAVLIYQHIFATGQFDEHPAGPVSGLRYSAVGEPADRGLVDASALGHSRLAKAHITEDADDLRPHG